MVDRKQFKQWLEKNYPKLKTITVSTTVSDAFFILNHDVGVTIDDLLDGTKSIEEYKNAVKIYLEKANKSVGTRPAGYASHVKYLVDFLGNKSVPLKVKNPNQIKNSSIKTNAKKNVILINNLFTGRYISKSDNIGHEFINIFQSDNNKFYVYANPYGSIDKKWNDRIEYVLFVRALKGEKRLKVIGYSKVLEQILKDVTRGNNHLEDNKIASNSQKEYIKKNDIKYGGLLLDNIFKYNDSSVEDSFYITFEAEQLFTPIEELVLPEKFSRTSESAKLYVTPENDQYRVIKDLLENESKWEKHNQKIEFTEKPETTIFSIIKKNYDETSISNLISYFLRQNGKLWNDVSKNIFGIDEKEELIEIIRESESNIDLFIRTTKSIIVIENKIRSSISGKNKEDRLYSQLSKYYTHALKRAKELGIAEGNVHFFILRPDYNNEQYSSYEHGKKYKEVKYSEIYKLANQHDTQIKHYDEFLKVLEKHSNKFDNEIFDDQMFRINDVIVRLKKNNE